MVKNLLTNAGDAGDMGLISGWGRSSGGGNGNPFQYSWGVLGNLMDREPGRLTVYGVSKSWSD